MFKRFMTPLGRELLEQLNNRSPWHVSGDGEDWTHKPSGVKLYRLAGATVRVAEVPSVKMSDDARRKLLNVWDQFVLHKAMGRKLSEHREGVREDAADAAINILRLSQHKEVNNV